ncbi:MAG: sigma-70 family RNA polymerase sigma factor [Planctomycetes bacterium]|nr:sigma-70 family RNA polymerase sigma factor [Planctomycetota bacterium]
MTDGPNAAELVHRWREGDEAAATALYERYAQKLMTLIGRHIARRFNSRFDADDVAQSVFGSLFRRTRDGHFQFEDDGDFWKLLLTIGLNKVRKKITFNDAAKRTPQREQSPADGDAQQTFLAECLSRTPSVVEIVTFADLLEELVSRLDPEAQQALSLRLEGSTQKEVAEKMQLRERQVRLLFDEIRVQTESLLDGG